MRKDPNDLPKPMTDVFVAISGGNINRSWLTQNGFKAATSKRSWDRYDPKRVLAWRYIEPFEKGLDKNEKV